MAPRIAQPLVFITLVFAACKQENQITPDAPTEADADTDADADADTDADTDLDTDPPTPSCTVALAEVWPEDGATQVLPGTPIEVRFDGAIAPTDPWTLGLAGIAGQATLDADAMGAVFAPDAALAPDTTYTVNATVCGDEATSAFTTLHAPLPPASVEGRTYAVPYATITFVTPAIANTLQPADWILIQVREVDEVAATLSAVAGLGNGPTPAPDCTNSFDAGVADFSANPQFSVGPTDFQIPWGADLVTIEDFEVEAVIGPVGGTVVDVVLLGNLDTRGITAVDNVCTLSAILGSPCQACRDGVVECLPVYATAAQGDAWPGVDVIGTCGL